MSDYTPQGQDQSAPPEIVIEESVVFGHNEHWFFCVGRVGDRWIGYAQSRGENYMHVIARVSECFKLGKLDRNAAIKLTSAIVDDPETSFGGIDEFLLDPILRGNPEHYRCMVCLEVGCPGDCKDYHDEINYTDELNPFEESP